MKNTLFIVLFVSLIFIPFTGNMPLFDWDEANFAEIAREMLIRGNWSVMTVNFEPFHEKPPLFFWIQAISMKIFGINEFAARFPNILIGMISLIYLFFLGKKLKGENFGKLLVLCFGGSFLPQFYFRFAVIDPLFNLLLFLAMVNLYLSLASAHPRWKNGILSAFFAGLALMTKGPAGWLLILIPVFVFSVIKFRKLKFNVSLLFLWPVIALLPFFLWMISGNNYGGFLTDFMRRNIELMTQKDAGHGGFLLFHWIAVFAGMFPVSVFAIENLTKKENWLDDFSLLMKILLFTVLIIFTLVRTKIIHYSSLAYFPVSWLAAESILKLRQNKSLLTAWVRLLGMISSFVLVFVMIAVLILIKFSYLITDYIQDDFLRMVLQSENTGINGIYLFTSITGIALLLAFYLWLKKPYRFEYQLIVVVMILFLNQWLWIKVLPVVQQYTQSALVSFCQERQDGNAYFLMMGSKSYLPYFYGKVQKDEDLSGKNKYEILLTPIQKRIYIISKVGKSEKIAEMYNLKELYRKNGWVFMVRKFDRIDQ